MATLSPISKLILNAAKRVLRDKTSIVMTKGGIFDSQFKSLVNIALKCEFTDSLLREEMDYLCRQECLDLIIKNDKYGDGTTHYIGDSE
jgi:hypothetical protein